MLKPSFSMKRPDKTYKYRPSLMDRSVKVTTFYMAETKCTRKNLPEKISGALTNPQNIPKLVDSN